ncbi:putative carbonyl reductase [Dendryphion nanum]|uniref:Carbonyl reductase n=1 Tax=Dendryphion nanum TaxID=256645 RepID=A0A9P9IXF2_9PLEO|nr:putative carbonyl reductase [Dendryphion nanum]
MALNQVPVVLITGATQGVGYSLAQILSQSKNPYHVLVGARNAERGAEAVSKLNATKTNSDSTVSVIEIDVCSDSSIQAAADKVSKDHGRLDILVNNAGVVWGENQSTSKREDWQTIFNTNVFGPLQTTTVFTPLLQKSSDAKLVVVSTSMGSIGVTESLPPHPLGLGMAPYSASKAAVNLLLVQWSKSLEGVRVWGIDPGLCATNFGGSFTLDNGRDAKEGADIVRQCIEGERDDFVGKVVFDEGGKSGARPW